MYLNSVSITVTIKPSNKQIKITKVIGANIGAKIKTFKMSTSHILLVSFIKSLITMVSNIIAIEIIQYKIIFINTSQPPSY